MALEKVINNGFGAYKSGESSVKPSYGVERIPFNGLVGADPSAGPEAFNLSSGDPRFVFTNGVGRWFYGLQDDNTGNGNFNSSIVSVGTFIGTTGVANQTVTGTLTINFFGTDLNLLIADALVGGTGNSWSIAPVVNGTAGTTITRTSGQNSPVLSNVTNVRGNQVLPLGLNLTAGNHTVVLTISLNPDGTNAVGAVLPLYGCEIVTEKAADNTTLTDISNGDIFSDGYRYRFTDTTPARPPVIPTAYSGSRGARVISYINPLTQIFEQAIENVDAAQANFAAATHANEEVIRKVNYREFGANSQFNPGGGATNRAFTLDDGTTTLSSNGNTQGTSPSPLRLGADTRYLTLTFVGTGLDVTRIDNLTGTNDANLTVDVDGLLIGNIPDGKIGSTQLRQVPIVSGLAYGTHTVRIRANGSINAFSPGFQDFIIYGPKKPTIPGSAVEIADYNIMADYNATTAFTTNTPSAGVLGKSPNKEFLYRGSVVLATADADKNIFGQTVAIQTESTGFVEYTFYGTGIELSASTASASSVPDATLLLDGLALGTTGTTVAVNSTYASGTSTWTQLSTNADRAILQISGLTLGVHTVRVTKGTVTVGDIDFLGAHIITPVHYQEDTLKVGSTSIGDVRPDFANIAADNPVVSNLGEAKAWINYDPLNKVIKGSYNVSAVIETTTNRSQAQIFFDKPFKDDSYVALSQIVATSPGSNNSIIANTFQQANFCRIQTENSGDTFGYSVAFFGELIDE